MATVLVVDDTKEITDVLVKFIERDGYDVVYAYGGDEALAKSRDKKIDVVVTDFYMPMGGLEMIASLKEQQVEPFKTILISGSGIVENPSLLSAQKSLGIHETFSKPINYQNLLAKIASLLDD